MHTWCSLMVLRQRETVASCKQQARTDSARLGMCHGAHPDAKDSPNSTTHTSTSTTQHASARTCADTLYPCSFLPVGRGCHTTHQHGPLWGVTTAAQGGCSTERLVRRHTESNGPSTYYKTTNRSCEQTLQCTPQGRQTRIVHSGPHHVHTRTRTPFTRLPHGTDMAKRPGHLHTFLNPQNHIR